MGGPPSCPVCAPRPNANSHSGRSRRTQRVHHRTWNVIHDARHLNHNTVPPQGHPRIRRVVPVTVDAAAVRASADSRPTAVGLAPATADLAVELTPPLEH